MRLFQIPFSHNCIKARHVLDLKGVDYEVVNINPALRGEVKRVSGQVLVPMLVDRGHVVSGSTPILLYLEEQPSRARAPARRTPRERAECMVLMDWADATFMALTRRLAYFQVLSAPGRLGEMFFPGMPAAAQRVGGRRSGPVLRRRFGIDAERNRRDEELARRAARVAVDRLGRRGPSGRGPAVAGRHHARHDERRRFSTRPRGARGPASSGALLEWGAGVLGKDFTPLGRCPRPAA